MNYFRTLKTFCMKKFVFLLFAVMGSFSAIAQIAIGTTTPDSSAVLELVSSDKGFLPPRVALSATNVAAPVNNPALFLMVCNTATAGTAPYDVRPGYYYWSGSGWQPIDNRGVNAGDMQYWNGSSWVLIPAGTEGDVLTWCGGKPQWGSCTKTLVSQPGPEGLDASLDYKPVCNGGNVTGADYPETLVSSWTYNGIGCGTGTIRYVIKFSSIDSLPLNAVIVSAKLSFYGVSSSAISPQGNSSYPGTPYSTTNEILVKRLLGAWDEATVTWNTQPASTTQDQVLIPVSTSRWDYDAADMDVTAMVQQMQVAGNYGFILQLQNENPLRNMNFHSGDSPVSGKRPKLVITYKTGN